jgi:hypothetical protein
VEFVQVWEKKVCLLEESLGSYKYHGQTFIH